MDPTTKAMLPREHLTGLVLAGGRGSRMGGVDKGLQPHGGTPLALHALRRLAPQVGPLMVNANRHLDAYAAMGVPVWPDAQTDYPGPLAGMLAGLSHCSTEWLVCVPCDTPNFPLDLVPCLAAALLAERAELAMAATREGDRVMRQPVFCLLHADLRGSLEDYLRAGERKIDRWAERHRLATAIFDDATAFDNANTPEELQRLRRSDG